MIQLDYDYTNNEIFLSFFAHGCLFKTLFYLQEFCFESLLRFGHICCIIYYSAWESVIFKIHGGGTRY